MMMIMIKSYLKSRYLKIHTVSFLSLGIQIFTFSRCPCEGLLPILCIKTTFA